MTPVSALDDETEDRTGLPTLAVVGATGAVGTVMLRPALDPRERLGRDPADRVRALGGQDG